MAGIAAVIAITHGRREAIFIILAYIWKNGYTFMAIHREWEAVKTGVFLEQYILPGCALEPISDSDAKLISNEMVKMDPWRTLGYSAAPLHIYLLQPDPALYRYAVKVDKATVGVIAVRYPWLKGAYLELIGLFPNQQKQGLGASLLAWLAQETAAHAPNVWVLVSAFNQAAKRFYLQAGFQEIGAIEALVSAASTELLLRKILRRVA